MVRRVRTEGGYSPITYSATANQVRKSDGYTTYPEATQVPESTRYDVVGEVKSMTDIVTPNFRKRIAEGGIINNPMSWARDSREGRAEGGSVFMESAYYSTTVDIAGDAVNGVFGVPTPRDVDADLLQHLQDLASTSALAGIEAPASQGMVFLAELTKTLSMLTNPCKGLVDYIRNRHKWKRRRNIGGGKAYTRDGRKGARESAKDVANAAAQSWLEARLGWRPFLMEIEAIIEALRNESMVPRQTSRATQTRTVTQTAYDTREGAFGSYWTMSVDFSYEYKETYVVRAGVLYDFSASTLSSTFGFRWRDLPESAWELIPFSFVVDWFLNVGDYIAALTPKAGTRVLASFMTTSIKREVTREILQLRLNGTEAQSLPTNGVHKRTLETFTRVTALPAPALTLELDLTQALRAGRALDAISLVTSILLGSKSLRK
jgi:hypothetical protein